MRISENALCHRRREACQADLLRVHIAAEMKSIPL
jgi:hypothetical protein